MHATTKAVRNGSSTAVTLAVNSVKGVFEPTFADAVRRIGERKRLKHGPFSSTACRESANAARMQTGVRE